MKKLFSLLAAVLFAGSMMAAEVTIVASDFTATTSANYSTTKESVTVAVTSSTVTADQMRIFKNQTITISSEYAITQIEFTCTANNTTKYGPGCFEAQEGYSFSGKIGTWVGSATSVTFKASSDQVRATQIVVTREGEGGDVPVVYDTITVAEAIAIADTLADNTASAVKYYVEGFAVNVAEYSPLYGNQDFFMVADVNAPDSIFMAYRATPKKDGKAYAVLAGDEVRALGKLKKYVNGNAVQLEIDQPAVEFISEVEGDHSIPEPKVDTITVARALAIGDSIGQGKTTVGQYVIEGYVTALTNNKGEATTDGGWAQYGNQCMWVADTYADTAVTKETAFFIYQGVAQEQVTKGAKIRVTCSIKNFNGMIETAVSKGAITILEKGEEPVQPAAPDTITVARALAIGDSIGQGKTTSEKYVVEGYVISTEAFDPGYKNQTWTMADDADASSAKFKAYRCVPVYNNDTVKVLKGDKVRLCGAIQNYNGTIEISLTRAEFLSMAEGDHSPSVPDPSQEVKDTITVARALEIGSALADKEVTNDLYAITGYVSSISEKYSEQYGNETFWITDDKGSYAASTKAGAFEVYRGKPNTGAEIGLDAKIRIVCKIKNYAGTIENDGTNIVFEVLEQGADRPVDTITVARALEIGQALDSAEISEKEYVIKGYVSSIESYYDTIYKNETFWMVDEKGSRAASNEAGAFEVYRGKPNTEAEIGLDAYVYVTAKIQNFRGNTIETSGTPLVNVIEQGHEEVIEAITVARALEIGDSIGVGNTTGDRYEITGYVSSIEEKYSEQYKNETFWITDEKGERTNNKSKAFEVYRGKPNTNAEIGMDAKIKIVCKIKNYNGTIENDGSNIVFEVLEQGVEEKIDTITVARALEIGQALDSAAITSQEYVIVGYVSNIINYYDTIYKNETFWMTDEKGSRAASNEAGAFEVYRGKPNTEAEIGLDAYVYVTAKIQNFRGTVVETSGTPLVNVIEPGHEEVIEAITVARAVEIGDSIGIGNTTDNRYEITGYVSSISEKYSEQYGNETFWITDEKGSYAASSKAGAFEVYRGKPNTGAEIGLDAKIKIVCKIKNYNGTIENDGSNIVFEVLEQGADRLMDTITVARALEIGQALDSAEISEKEYVIAGYVSSIVNYYDSVYKNETFWIADSLGSRAASNAEGAFEVYRGKPNTEAEIGLNAYVYVTAKIQNFRGNTIETSGTPLVEVVIPGIEEVIDSITVARAIEIGDSIGIGNTTDDRYEITGYVSYIEEQYSEQYGNETFWITDTKGERTNDPTKAFEVYRGKPNTGVEIGMDAKIKIVCKIKNFKGTIENDGTNIPFEVLEQGTELKYDTLTVKEALAIIDTLAEGATTLDKYIVKGYIAEVTTPYDAQYGNMTIGLNDKFNRLTADLTCYRAKVAEDDVERASVGAYVYVFGKLQNFKKNAQMAQGGQITIAEAPKIDTVQVSLAEAIAIGTALEEDEETDVFYAVTGYVADIIDPGEGTQSFMMSDDEQATTGEFYVDMATIETQATVHQQVCVYGWITNYMGFASIAQGEAVILYQEGIEQLVLTEKAQKVMVDGAIYIIRDNKLYNLQGAQVR